MIVETVAIIIDITNEDCNFITKGKTIKNTKTLVTTWKKIKSLTGDLEANVNQINEQNFGYVLFPFNNLNSNFLQEYPLSFHKLISISLILLLLI